MDEVEDFFGNGEFDGSPEGDEAIEVNAGTSDDKKLNDMFEKEVVKPKRVMQPRLVLNEQLMVGPKGIPALKGILKDFKPDPNSNPYQNFKNLKKKYAYWGHLMFPRMKVDDILSRCETLGTRRQVKVFMMKTRLGMNLTDEDFEQESRKTKKTSSKKRKSVDIIDDGADDDKSETGKDRNKSDDEEETSRKNAEDVIFGKEVEAERSNTEEDSEKTETGKNYDTEDFEEMEVEARENAEDEILADFDVNNDW